MPYILAIDTATAYCSVALCENDRVLASKSANDRFDHARLLTSYIEDVLGATGLQISEVDALAVSIGPGSYTGLRVGLSTAKGICYALNKKLILVSTLEAQAHGAHLNVQEDYNLIMPMIDARRMEVYTAAYSKDLQEVLQPFAYILDVEDLTQRAMNQGPILATGDGAQKIAELGPIEGLIIDPRHMHATFMCKPALIKYKAQDFGDVAYSEPFYLKPPNITRPKRTKL